MAENLRFALKLVLDGAANVDSAAYHTEVFAARSVHSVEALLQLLPAARMAAYRSGTLLNSSAATSA